MAKRDDEMTPAEAAARLGYRQVQSVHQLYRAGKLTGREEPAGLFGRRIYVQRADVERLARALRETQ